MADRNCAPKKYLQPIPFLLLIFLLFIPPQYIHSNINLSLSIDKDNFNQFYAEGKSFFYDTLKLFWYEFSLDEESIKILCHAENRFPGLYEHLMSFYYYLDPINEGDVGRFRSHLLNISIRMAQDFIKSIPRKSLREEISPIKSILMSTGYYSKPYIPHFSRFIRNMGRYVKQQWALDELGIREVQSFTKGRNIKIAIIDTGIDPTIKETRTRIKDYKNLLDGSKPIIKRGKFPYDWEGHGTSIASLIYQIAPEVELIIVKFYERESMQQVPPSRWTGYLLAAGMIWAADNGADIINLSVSLKEDMDSIQKAAKYCWDKNVILVASMGNVLDGPKENIPGYPASYPWTIAVGGVEKEDNGLKIWKNSAIGDYIDIVAPAKDLAVEVPVYRGRQRIARRAYGNSLAASFVSGSIALLLSTIDKDTKLLLKQTPGNLVEKVRNILRQSASNEILGYHKPNPFSGYGLINIQMAIKMLKKELISLTAIAETYPSLPQEGAGFFKACPSPLSSERTRKLIHNKSLFFCFDTPIHSHIR